MEVRLPVGFIFRHLQSAGLSADIPKMETGEKMDLHASAVARSRGYVAWCLLAAWVLSSAAVLYQHMADNPPGLCRAGGAAVR